jgi:hypothetical protein
MVDGYFFLDKFTDLFSPKWVVVNKHNQPATSTMSPGGVFGSEKQARSYAMHDLPAAIGEEPGKYTVKRCRYRPAAIEIL